MELTPALTYVLHPTKDATWELNDPQEVVHINEGKTLRGAETRLDAAVRCSESENAQHHMVRLYQLHLDANNLVHDIANSRD